MNKIILNEESTEFATIWEDWKKQAESMKTIDEFNNFYNHLINGYHHDYGTVCRAIGQLAIAAAQLGATIEGITGFQAGFIMWEFIRNWTYKDNKTGLKILNYDNMLYPQYEYKFDKTIDEETWKRLQKEAAERLEEDKENKYVHSDVIKHWQSIVDGIVPFGYRVER